MKTQTIVAIAVVASIPLLMNLTYEGTRVAADAVLMAADRRPAAAPTDDRRPVLRPTRPRPNTGGGSPKVVIL